MICQRSFDTMTKNIVLKTRCSLTCVSVRFKDNARFNLSQTDKYLVVLNLFSNDTNCSYVKAVLALRGLEDFESLERFLRDLPQINVKIQFDGLINILHCPIYLAAEDDDDEGWLLLSTDAASSSISISKYILCIFILYLINKCWPIVAKKDNYLNNHLVSFLRIRTSVL